MYKDRLEEHFALSLNNKSFGTWRTRLLILITALVGISSVLSVIILSYGAFSFYLVLVGLIALPLIYAILAFPKVGIVLLLSLAYIIMFLARFANGFPLGTVMDGIVVLLIIGFFLKQKYVKDWTAFKEPVGIVMIIWIVYNFAEVVNPSASSTMAWLYAIRPIVLVAITYFLFYFHIRDVQFIRLLLKLWLCFSVIAALYTLKQEYFGFANFEMQWIKSDPLLTRLYYIGNHWRKFGIFSDPVSMAYNMVISSIVCFCLLTGPFAIWKKMILGALGCLFVLAMLYSGTRGAYVLFPVAYLLFSILKYNKKVMIAGICAACIMAVLIIMPTSNYTLYRFQTAFKPSKDASYLVRKENQKRIQPYIQSHPMGGGIGSTGVWGKRFSPYSYLASFPPDSGYVRVAVEQGWLGLLLFCTLMFTVMRQGIINYFAIRDPELKSYCFAMIMVIFALNAGNYPQEALVQYPINTYFYLAIALLGVTLKIDRTLVRGVEDERAVLN